MRMKEAITPTKKFPRIVFVSTMGGVAWGGSEELWSQTALQMLKMGCEVCASVYQWPTLPTRLYDISRAGGLIHYRPRVRNLLGRTLEKFRQKLLPGPLDSEYMVWLRDQKPDLVVISQGGPWDGVPWMTACRKYGLPYCPIVHAHSEIWWPEDAALEDGQPALAEAQKVFFVSIANRDQMEMQAGMRLPHAEVVINPWKVDSSQPVAWPTESSTVQIACVGRIDPRAKGQDLLFRVLALPKWRERPIQLNIYGDGPCEDSLKAMAELLGLENVVFKGQVSDVRGIWAANHALVLPSRFEGLPLVIIEAMFCGRPVITTDIAGNAEYLQDGVTGFIAEAPSVGLLDDAMERAWQRKSEWQEMGLKARQRLLDELPSDPIGKFAETLLEVANQAGKEVALR